MNPSFRLSVDVDLRGRPHIVTVRPVTGFTIQMLADALRTNVTQRVTQHGGNGDNVFGFLMGANITNPNVYSGDRINANDISARRLGAIFKRIHQSNIYITLGDIEWSFAIDPNVYVRGGAVTVRAPKWVDIYHETWRGHEGINCAAFALVWLMYCKKRNYARKDTILKRQESDARRLMEEMGWDDTIGVDELGDFVDTYEEYKLVVVTEELVKGSTTPFWVWSGKKYVARGGKNILYLCFDAEQMHYAAVDPAKMGRSLFDRTLYVWCHTCLRVCTAGHSCFTKKRKYKEEEYNTPCEKCGEIGHKLSGTFCYKTKCKTCDAAIGKGVHRCILYKADRKEENNTWDTGKLDGVLPALIVYDFESCLDITESTQYLISRFEVADGKYVLDDEGVAVTVKEYKSHKHRVMYAAAKNVKTGEVFDWYGLDALERFMDHFMAYNFGNCVMVAHNASGYDTRFVMNECARRFKYSSISTIMRGGKIMQLTLKGKVNYKHKTVFIDSMLHVRGSLKSLAKDFCDGLLKKGFFPHLFNKPENLGYVGPMPGREYFDLTMSCRSQKDLDEFEEWYSGWEGDWDMEKECRTYGKNDVEVLAKICVGYEESAMKIFGGMSPWFNPTNPSYVHEAILIQQTKNALDGLDAEEDGYTERIQELAWNETWAVLKPYEWKVARKALRGGRTEMSCVYRKVTDEEAARGCKIRYQDICSEYPYQQIVHDFPVGLPTIIAWDQEYTPCIKCLHFDVIKCSCRRGRNFPRDLRVVQQGVEPSVQEILADDSFFGVVIATVLPSRLLHPVLVHYDEKKKKCIASCERIVEGVFTSVEFKEALRQGYKIEKLHALHKYKKAPSLWRDATIMLFINKMINSKNEPSDEAFEQLVRDYEEEFGWDFSDEIRKTKGKWGKRPAMKLTAKIMINSVWGKHAERAVQQETSIIGFDKEEEIYALFSNFAHGKFTFDSAMAFGEKAMIYKYTKNENVEPDLHRGYMPAALFVPAYGRLQLLRQKTLLGDRVLYCDTDSIIYFYDPALYNIPVSGLLGGWEVEDVDEDHGGIREMVALGAKTYAFQCMDGFTPEPKAKGVRLNYATSNLANFEAFKKIALDIIREGRCDTLMIPQTNFVWNLRNGMSTVKNLKKLGFNPDELKGDMDENGYIWPFGYDEAHLPDANI